MMSRQTWASISVYDFFRTYNWTGETTDLVPFDSVEFFQKSQSLLSLNLREFLIQSNWKGDKKAYFFSQSIQPSNQSLLRLSVNNCFRQIRWEKPLEIAPTSNKLSLKPPDDKTSSNLDLNNLSDLF
ncbi:MAG: hypothetical protein QNJ33_14925 [Crocosphaera sp.]|nr:hypothetical protein [Crocosphaera sp.]